MTDQSDTAPSVVIERTLDAPAALVWRMWTEPEHFKAWYGPTGATIVVAEMDVRVGGTRFVGMEMQAPDGAMSMWFTGEHREVDPPRRLAYTESIADEQGNAQSPTDMGMPPGHPEVTEVIVELDDLGDTTGMTMTHAGVPADSPGAAGWGMAFDKLEAHLGTVE